VDKPIEPLDCRGESLVVVSVLAELLAELVPLLGVAVGWLAAVAWLPGLLTAAAQPMPKVAAKPARVAPTVAVLSRWTARLRSAGVRRCACCIAGMVRRGTFRTDYAASS